MSIFECRFSPNLRLKNISGSAMVWFAMAVFIYFINIGSGCWFSTALIFFQRCSWITPNYKRSLRPWSHSLQNSKIIIYHKMNKIIKDKYSAVLFKHSSSINISSRSIDHWVQKILMTFCAFLGDGEQKVLWLGWVGWSSLSIGHLRASSVLITHCNTEKAFSNPVFDTWNGWCCFIPYLWIFDRN